MVYMVDYEAGNLMSVQKAANYLGIPIELTSDPGELMHAEKIIFPGVGAFGKAMESLKKLDLIRPLAEAIVNGTPFLGICLGMQLLFEKSEENEGVPGLGILQGSVKRFSGNLKVPHLGWNILKQVKTSPLFANVPQESYFYFAHSYYVQPTDHQVVIGQSDYGEFYPVAIQQRNLFGVQFHPEKSQKYGLEILKNFLNL